MSPDEENPKPASGEPAIESADEPAPEGVYEPEVGAEEQSLASSQQESPVQPPPSAEIVEAVEAPIQQEPAAAPLDELEPEPEPEPESQFEAETEVEPAAPPPPILREPLAPAYDQHGANAPNEPMSDDAFLQPHAQGEQSESLFGTPESQPDIRFPGEGRARGPRMRDAQANLDLDLGRIKRRKRYGLLLTTLSVFFVALILAPVTWALAYLFFDPPSTVLMLQRASEGQAIRHTPVPLNRISPFLIRSVIASEDSNFCTHHGFDVNAIQDAIESNADGGRLRGGSTISQQTAKNLFLWPQRSWVRKGFETYFTALIEFMWPKHRIMEAYLNSAEWGDGNFGAEAAARARFGVSAADLSPLQAARLAAVLPSPNRWRADSPGPYVRRRAATIVERAQVVRNSHMASCVLLIDAPQ